MANGQLLRRHARVTRLRSCCIVLAPQGGQRCQAARPKPPGRTRETSGGARGCRRPGGAWRRRSARRCRVWPPGLQTAQRLQRAAWAARQGAAPTDDRRHDQWVPASRSSKEGVRFSDDCQTGDAGGPVLPRMPEMTPTSERVARRGSSARRNDACRLRRLRDPRWIQHQTHLWGRAALWAPRRRLGRRRALPLAGANRRGRPSGLRDRWHARPWWLCAPCSRVTQALQARERARRPAPRVAGRGHSVPRSRRDCLASGALSKWATGVTGRSRRPPLQGKRRFVATACPCPAMGPQHMRTAKPALQEGRGSRWWLAMAVPVALSTRGWRSLSPKKGEVGAYCVPWPCQWRRHALMARPALRHGRGLR